MNTSITFSSTNKMRVGDSIIVYAGGNQSKPMCITAIESSTCIRIRSFRWYETLWQQLKSMLVEEWQAFMARV